MKLNRVQTKRDSEIFQVLRIRMVDKDANDRYERRQFFDDLSRPRRLDVTRAARVKVQPDCVCSQQRRVARVFEFGDAANLDARHSRLRIAAEGSADVSKCSPTRNASAPALRSRSISALL